MTKIEAEIDFVQMAEDVACIKLAVLGNGKKGLCQRVDDLEKNDQNQHKITGMWAGVGIVLGSAITYIIQFFKG